MFVNSMSDLFHKNIPDDYLRQVWDVMLRADQHTYQVLTKRAHRMVHKIRTLSLPVPAHIWLGAIATRPVPRLRCALFLQTGERASPRPGRRV